MVHLIVDGTVDDWLLKSLKNTLTVSNFMPIHPFTKEKYLQTNLVWYLATFKGMDKSGTEFFSYCPADLLKGCIKEADVIKAITNFDFGINYIANENDFFFIKEAYYFPDLKGKKRPPLYSAYMSFSFINNQWVVSIRNDDYLYNEVAKGTAIFEI
jgi:hypothetical protein